MLSIEMYLIKETLLNWFTKKIKSTHLSIPLIQKINYGQRNPINWTNNKCCICNFKLDIMPPNFETSTTEMTYGNFFIRLEHKFLRNIYLQNELNECSETATVKAYYETYIKLINICICLQNVWEVRDFYDFSLFTKKFISEERDNNFTISELRENIDAVEIKNLTKSKIPHRLLKVMAYVYQNLICFPSSKFEYEIVASVNFFRNLHRILKVKVHLHHSHITGDIKGYSHDFCNWTVREYKTELSIIAHNLFGFDTFFFLKGFQATTWNTKNVSIGGNNLTSINYMNINGSETKFSDTSKYYQTTLAGLTKTATGEEKEGVKHLTIDFFKKS